MYRRQIKEKVRLTRSYNAVKRIKAPCASDEAKEVPHERRALYCRHVQEKSEINTSLQWAARQNQNSLCVGRTNDSAISPAQSEQLRDAVIIANRRGCSDLKFTACT